MRPIIICFSAFILTIVLSLLVSVYIPAEVGSISLDKPAEAYSNTELRDMARKKFGSEASIAKHAERIGLFVQAIPWILLALLVKTKEYFKFIVFTLASLGALWVIKIITVKVLLISALLVSSVMCVKYFVKKQWK